MKHVQKLTIIFLFIIPNITWAQVMDTIMFDNITINNDKLFTKFSHIEKYFDITKSMARLWTYTILPMPFKELLPHNPLPQDTVFCYEIDTPDFIYFYSEQYPDSIFITNINATKKLVLKITLKETTIVFPKRNNLSRLRKMFRNSYSAFQANYKEGKEARNEFCLIVKHGNQYAYCYLIFDGNDRFVEMSLYDPNVFVY